MQDWVESYDIYTANKWTEIPLRQYNQMFEVLPPLHHSLWHFLNSEPYTHNADGKAVYFAYKDTGAKCYAKAMTVKEYKKEFGLL